MKKIAFILAGLLLMGIYGCGSDEAKKAAKETKEAATVTEKAAGEAADKAAEVAKDAATATQEAAGEAADKAAEATK